ncbi:MAG: TIGR00282 family metallophosphoesterase [Bacteroidetes bacterium]|nr:TIGR00282 family metallophosphoesterase [Bacteroidota bacterium]
MSQTLNVMMIGDIISDTGLNIAEKLLPSLITKHSVDFVIANGENLHEGRGLNEDMIKRLYTAGVHVITGGNHSFDKHKIFPYMATDKRLLRPLNYPKGNPGYGYGVFDIPGGKGKISVLNLQGRTFMYPIDCPFKTADWAVEKLKQESRLVFVDFHADASAEKVAMGWYLNGKVTAVLGTHTHVPTADERILPEGTAYISDVGMTGPYDSVIGMKKEAALKRFVLGTPSKYESATEDNHFSSVVVSCDSVTGKATSIKRVFFPEF